MKDDKSMFTAKLDSLRDKQIFLYGAKNMGDFAYLALSHYGIQIAGYVLTKHSFNRVLNGLPIYSIDELPTVADANACILLTLNEKYHTEVKASLQQIGFTNINETFSGFNFYHYFFAEICSNIFNQNGVDLTKDVFELGRYRQINPYIHDYMKSFYLEAEDLILPALFNNYDFVVEGPYEYGDVILSGGDIVIDCGANIGLFSCYAASKGCISYAFEPVKEHLSDILEKQSAINDFCIKVFPCALADKHGKMTINLSPHDESSSLVMWGDTYTTSTVNVTTIDRFVEEKALKRVDFIKADIEGAERLMLAGAKETLKRFAPKLAICTYHLEDDPQVLEAIIKEANPNYKVVHKWKKLFASV